MRRLPVLIAFATIAASTGISQPATIHKNFNLLFGEFHVRGSFLLYDLKQEAYTVYDSARCRKQFTPASTFKIVNSLIGLETGVIPDAHFTIPWDSVAHERPEWNRDHDLASAFKYSVVWYYQELARRVGVERMKHYVDTVGYGNRDMGGGVDEFWLNGHLSISQYEQIDLLEKLYKNQLPFSRRSTDIVKSIMVMEDTLGYVLRAKTGLGNQDGKDIGWWVGYVERGGNVYFFATNLESEKATAMFSKARIELTKRILRDLAILP